MTEHNQALFKRLTQGVYVISVKNKEIKHAFTAAWVMQVSFNPFLVGFSINPEHQSYKILKEGGVCCISVLNNEQLAIAAHFGSSHSDEKMSGYQWLDTETGAPALTESLAYFDCRVDHYSEAGDHKLVICQVLNGAELNAGQPMLYSETGDMDNSAELYKK